MIEKDYRKYAPFFLLSDNTIADKLESDNLFLKEDLFDYFNIAISKNSKNSISLSNNKDIECLVIPHWNNPRWFVPNDKNIVSHVGNIIKPTSRKAVIIWKIALFLNCFGLIDKIFRSKIFIQTDNTGSYYLKNNSDNNYIIYTGAKGIYQKFTFQEMNEKKEVVSFTKAGKNKFASVRLNNEASVLRLLSDVSFTTFEHPFLLDYYQKEGITFLKQAPCKNDFSRMLMGFTDLHRGMLSEIHQKCRKEINVGEYLKSLEQEIREGFQIDNTTCSFLLNGLSRVKKNLKSSRIEFVLSHGDFTPWNCFYNGKILYVFDWEMGAYRMPLWDYFNFIYHSVFLTVGYKVKKINKKLYANISWAKLLADNDLYDNCHLIYLIEMTLHYLQQCQELSRYEMHNNVFVLVQNFSKLLKTLVKVNETPPCQYILLPAWRRLRIYAQSGTITQTART